MRAGSVGARCRAGGLLVDKTRDRAEHLDDDSDATAG